MVSMLYHPIKHFSHYVVRRGRIRSISSIPSETLPCQPWPGVGPLKLTTFASTDPCYPRRPTLSQDGCWAGLLGWAARPLAKSTRRVSCGDEARTRTTTPELKVLPNETIKLNNSFCVRQSAALSTDGVWPPTFKASAQVLGQKRCTNRSGVLNTEIVVKCKLLLLLHHSGIKTTKVGGPTILRTLQQHTAAF